MFLDQEPGLFEFTIVARAHVRAYEISRIDALKKMPPNFKLFLIESVKQRLKWLKIRAKALENTNSLRAKMNPLLQRNEKEIFEIGQKFPNINKNAILCIQRNKTLNRIKFESSTNLMIPKEKASNIIEKKLEITRSASTTNARLPRINKKKRSMLNIRRSSGNLTSRSNVPRRIQYEMSIATSTSNLLKYPKLVPRLNASLLRSKANQLISGAKESLYSSFLKYLRDKRQKETVRINLEEIDKEYEGKSNLHLSSQLTKIIRNMGKQGNY